MITTEIPEILHQVVVQLSYHHGGIPSVHYLNSRRTLCASRLKRVFFLKRENLHNGFPVRQRNNEV